MGSTDSSLSTVTLPSPSNINVTSPYTGCIIVLSVTPSSLNSLSTAVAGTGAITGVSATITGSGLVYVLLVSFNVKYIPSLLVGWLSVIGLYCVANGSSLPVLLTVNLPSAPGALSDNR